MYTRGFRKNPEVTQKIAKPASELAITKKMAACTFDQNALWSEII
jgi:hypothetical protein